MLRLHLPPGLELDIFDGRAWLGIVPFRMEDVAPRGLPALPGLSVFPELNVRTYVTHDGSPGVWFLSLDAASWPTVVGARRWFHLPYVHAAMSIEPDGVDGVVYRSERRDAAAPPASLRGPLSTGRPGRAGDARQLRGVVDRTLAAVLERRRWTHPCAARSGTRRGRSSRPRRTSTRPSSRPPTG